MARARGATNRGVGGLAGLGDFWEYLGISEEGAVDSGGSWLADISGAVRDIYATYTSAELQRDLARVNLDRANRGLQPISSSQVAPQMNVGISADTKKLLIVGGAVAAGIFLLPQFTGRRRRR